MEARFEHVCPCSETTFWREVAFDDEFNRRLFFEILDYERFDVQSLRETDTEIRRLLEAAPKVGNHVPGSFRRLLGRGLAYRETDIFDKKNRRCHTVIVPAAHSRRVSIRVNAATEPLGLAQCRCIYSITVTTTIFASLGGTSAFGIGRVVEDEIVKQLIDGFEARAAFTTRFVTEKGLGAPYPFAG